MEAKDYIVLLKISDKGYYMILSLLITYNKT